jgi:serine protease Do
MTRSEPTTPRLEFVVETCEAAATPSRKVPFTPPSTRPIFSPFETGDPFGLRKAVLPLFERTPAGALVGMGTAFHLDGWGGFLTAEHVVDFLRDDRLFAGVSGGSAHELDPTVHSHAIMMLGIGLVYGQVAAPDWAFVPVIETLAVTCERDDPLAILRGESSREVAFDIAGLMAAIPAAAYDAKRDSPKTLPVQLSGWSPTVGEYVLALGYPELEPSAAVSDATLRTLIKDGLFAAYGKITRLFPEGRDRMNRTPVFEVAANWPSGMSGGPVVNEAGIVVGVVSRSLAPDGDALGIGYAASLSWIGEIRRLAPRVDPENPGWRLGYAILADSGQVLSFWPTPQIASNVAQTAGIAIRVAASSNKIGTDEYMFYE